MKIRVTKGKLVSNVMKLVLCFKKIKNTQHLSRYSISKDIYKFEGRA